MILFVQDGAHFLVMVAFLGCLEARWGLLSETKQVRSSFCYVAVGKNMTFFCCCQALLQHISVSDRIGRVARLMAALALHPAVCV